MLGLTESVCSDSNLQKALRAVHGMQLTCHYDCQCRQRYCLGDVSEPMEQLRPLCIDYKDRRRVNESNDPLNDPGLYQYTSLRQCAHHVCPSVSAFEPYSTSSL